MSAISCMRKELARIQRKQAQCITESGYVKPQCREEYNLLVKQAQVYKDSLDQMLRWKEEGWKITE